MNQIRLSRKIFFSTAIILLFIFILLAGFEIYLCKSDSYYSNFNWEYVGINNVETLVPFNRKDYYFKNPGSSENPDIYCNPDGHRAEGPGTTDYDASIAFFGDSNLFGYQIEYHDTLQYYLEKSTGRKIANFAVISQTSRELLYFVEKALESKQWPGLRLAVIMSGINDCWNDPIPRHYLTRNLNRFWIGWKFIALYEKLGLMQPEYVPRVGFDEFRRNIERVESLLASHHIKTLYMSAPVPYFNQLVLNEEVIADYYAEKPDLLRYFRPASYWPKELEAARQMGLEQYFPTIPDIQKLNYLKYERFLRNQDNFFDTNSVIQTLDPYEIFIPGFRTEDHVYPDHCHLNSRGWEIVARSLSSRIADILHE